MKDQIKHWTKEDFLAYLLIHAADADFNIAPVEKKLILTMIPQETYDSILLEYEKDNDNQGLEKIIAAKEYLNLGKEECEMMLEDIQAVFKADDDYDILEKNMYMGIKKLLRD